MRPWSFSRLGTIETCPKSYEYGYIEKVEVATESISPAAARGQDIHSKAEDYLAGRLSVYPHELQKVAGHAMKLKSLGAKPEVKMAVKEDWSVCEYEDKEAYFRAILDISYELRGDGYVHAHIQDWKTGQVYPDHEDQLKQYVVIAASYFPEATEFHTRLIYTDQGVVTPIKITPRSKIEGMRLMLDGRIKNAEKETIFPVRPGQHCRWCDYSKKKGGPCQY